jgi:hypothetical protein
MARCANADDLLFPADVPECFRFVTFPAASYSSHHHYILNTLGEWKPLLRPDRCRAIRELSPDPSIAVGSRQHAASGRQRQRVARVGTPHSDMIWCTSITLPSGSWKKIWCHPFIAHVP